MTGTRLSFVWGTDLSGTMQGAGGVGGLKALIVHNGPLAGTYFYSYDGNGNVAALVNAADGTEAARYEYGPFLELLRATGPLARLNPFRASTKYQDDETDLLYYGFRYLSTVTGRWLGRDPIGERGGQNLFAFVRNNPLSWSDKLGLDPVGAWISKRYWHDWWWQLSFEDPDDIAYRNDGAGNTMAQRTFTQMDDFYKSVAAKQGIKITGEWQTFQIPKGPTGTIWIIPRHAGIDFSDAGFWLSQAHQVVSQGGSFELRCTLKDQKVEIRNTRGKFRWIDRVDNRPDRSDPLYFWLLETINQVPEWITGADFDVWIDWQDNRNEIRELFKY